jgi:hypothetical protein
MKLLFKASALVVALAVSCSVAVAQVTPGSSPLSIAKGGTGGATASSARTNLGLGSIATQSASAVAITGGAITGLPTPSNPSDAATKSYADGLAAGLTILSPSRLATAAALSANTYNNGSSGVGATLTANANAALSVDGTAVNVNDVVLVKNEATAANNGIYTVTQTGSGSAPYILTRATYFNQSSNMLKGDYTFISAGSANINSAWTLSATVTTVGTTAVTFNQFSSAGVANLGGLTGSVSCGAGLSCGSGAIVSTAVPVFNITQSPYSAKCNYGFKSDIAMASGSTTATSASGWAAGDVGKYIIIQGAGANIGSATTTITNGTASIAATNSFGANQVVVFSANVGTNIVSGTAYYVSSVGLSGSAFQISATQAGTVITPNGSGTPNAFTSGNLVTTIATFVNSTTVTLTTGNTSGFNISSRTAEYGNDDATAINSAISAAVSAGGGTVYLPAGKVCMVSQINFTNVTIGVSLKGEGISASRLMPLQNGNYGGATGHVIDLTGSEQIILQDFQLGAFNGLAQATTGIFMAQVSSGASNRIRMQRIYVSGQYSGASLYDYGVPSWDAISSDFYNYSPGAGNHGVAYFTASNAFSYTSPFATVASGAQAASDIHLFACEFHKFGATGADNWVIRQDGTANIAFYGGVINGGATAYVFYDNTVAHISYFNVTFENEGPATVTVPLYGHDKISGTITDLNDVGSAYGYSSGKFNIGSTPTNLVTNGL